MREDWAGRYGEDRLPRYTSCSRRTSLRRHPAAGYTDAQLVDISLAMAVITLTKRSASAVSPPMRASLLSRQIRINNESYMDFPSEIPKGGPPLSSWTW
jgi:hypothetical protein